MVNKDEKPEENGNTFNDSGELFEAFFTQELKAFRKDKKEKLKAGTQILKKRAAAHKARLAARQKEAGEDEKPAEPKRRTIKATEPAPYDKRLKNTGPEKSPGPQGGLTAPGRHLLHLPKGKKNRRSLVTLTGGVEPPRRLLRKNPRLPVRRRSIPLQNA